VAVIDFTVAVNDSTLSGWFYSMITGGEFMVAGGDSMVAGVLW